MKRILVGLSGGVDSAVTAYLLKIAGYDVIGFTLRTWVTEDGEDSRCCEIDDARAAADMLGIPYYVRNCMSEFRTHVTQPFVNEYVNGHTPNPCIVCNRYIKWDKMLEAADQLDAQMIATGHYANIIRLENGRYTVKTADHAEKDQTYMLCRLTQEHLSRTLMPLGGLSKVQVREIAKQTGLPSAEKPDSQEICFVTQGDHRSFIENNFSGELPPEGYFKDTEGNIIGRHRGIYHYTIGQRRGLGLALGYPAYVQRINGNDNTVTIGDEKCLYSREIYCTDISFMGIEKMGPGKSLRCNAGVRYHHKAQECTAQMLENGKMRILFDKPVRAAAAGQSAVLYNESGCILCSGFII